MTPDFDPPSGSPAYDYAFASHAEAREFAVLTPGAANPLGLVLQRAFDDGASTGAFVHVRRERVAEWPVTFLRRPRRTDRTIRDFLAPDAPPNRLAILRGEA